MSINNMKKVILFCVMILVSSFIYADEVRDVNGEARGFSNTNVIINILETSKIEHKIRL